MATVVEVSDMAALRTLLVDKFGARNFRVRPYGFDARIGWDTHIVIMDGDPIGFTDGPIGGDDEPCPMRDDGIHCECFWDGDARCCGCGQKPVES